MKKIVNIEGKDYTMQSSAFTQFAYRDITGRSLLKDLEEITKIATNENDFMQNISKLDKITEPLLDVAYVMIKEGDPNQVLSREEFYKSIESVYDNFDWILDVISLAVNPLSRQLQKNQK